MKVGGSLRSNSAEAIRSGGLQGLDLGIMIRASLGGELADADVVPVLQEYLVGSLDVSVVWPRRRFTPARVRYATEFFARVLPPVTA